MRNYTLMRGILLAIRNADKPLIFDDFSKAGTYEDVREELLRLSDENLIAEEITPNNLVSVEMETLTKEGANFARCIENDRVFAIVYRTLKEADLDLSYPFLKEVCDEVAKRYVMSKIPNFD